MFLIEFRDMEWIDGAKDDPQDLCSHGEVTIVLDDVRISDACCTSAAALRMMRSVTEDHEMEDKWKGEQMLPCCGHEMYPSADEQTVTLLSCPYGSDFGVCHHENTVVITTEAGQEFEFSIAEYAGEILKFVESVENFYKNASPKVMPSYQHEADGYRAFWNEWKRRKNDLKNFYFPENNA